jgi:hypothetical protein
MAERYSYDRYMIVKIFCGATAAARRSTAAATVKNYYFSIEKVSYQISFLISKFYIIKLLVFYHTDQ